MSFGKKIECLDSWLGLILLGHWLMVSEWLYVGDLAFVSAMHGI